MIKFVNRIVLLRFCGIFQKLLDFTQRLWYNTNGDDNMQTLGNYLRQKREEKGFSLSYVYNKTGITDSRLSKTENDLYKEPSPLLLKKLAEIYK